MWRRKSKTKKASRPINSVSFSLANNLKMAELWVTTTFRKSLRFTLFFAWEVACRFSSRPWPERPSLLKLSRATPLKTWRQRSKTKKASPQTNRGWSSLVSSWKMVVLLATTIFRRSPLYIWCCVFVAECRSSWKPWPERPSRLKSSRAILLRMWRQKSKTKKASLPTNRGWSSLESSWKMVALWATIISRRSPPFIWCCVFVAECRSSWKPWLAKPLPWK